MDSLLSTEQLAAELANTDEGNRDLLVFDCTVFLRRPDDGPYVAEPGRADFEAGHIPGSSFLDQMAELSDQDSALRFTALDPDRLAAAFAARGVGADSRVVLYDRAFNMWATRVWWLLRSIGFDRASVLDGGWKAWTADGRDQATGPGLDHQPAELAAAPRGGLIVGRAEVEAATSNDQVCLINALSPEVHDGSDTSYGRPGHIPTSTNVYAISLVDPATHRYRPIDELRAVFDDAGVTGTGDDGRIITWCGGGIAATSDAFILTALLDRDDVGIYDGSLSEWVAADLPSRSDVGGRSGTDDALTKTEATVVDEAIAFASTHLEPMAETWEAERRFATEAFAALGPAGLCGLLVPTELGGRGVGPVALARVLEELASADLAAAFSAVVHNNMARAVANSGNEKLIGDLLPSLVTGATVGAFLLTEPGFGSDAAKIACRAERDGDEWVISGSKAWVTNASHAGALNLYAQTDRSLGHRGIVSIVVDPEADGVTRTAPYDLMGAHAMGTGGFEFDQVRAPVADTLVPVGQAFAAAMAGIDLARVLVGAMCCGILRRSLEVALAATSQRQVFGTSVADKQGVQWMLADVATDLEAMRLLTFRAARQLQNGEDACLMAAHAKKFAARVAQERVADCMQVMGAVGYRRDPGNPLPRHLAAARLTGYIDGATEIQNVVIARSLWSEYANG